MEVPMLITDFLDRAVRLYPDKVAIVDGGQRFTYREFNERVDRLSNALLDLGIDRCHMGFDERHRVVFVAEEEMPVGVDNSR